MKIEFTRVGDPTKWGDHELGVNLWHPKIARFAACLLNWWNGYGWVNGFEMPWQREKRLKGEKPS